MRKETQQEPAWKPSMEDVRKLEEGMSSFAAKEVNGKKQYPFELYLADRGVIRFGDYGEKIVLSTEAYWKMGEIYDLMMWKKEKDLEAIFQQFPEERKAHQEKIRAIFADMRRVGDNVKS